MIAINYQPPRETSALRYPCGHYGAPYEQTNAPSSGCPVCGQIESKIAMHEEAIENLNQIIEAKNSQIKAVREEVLELAIGLYNDPNEDAWFEDRMRQAYKERFGNEQG